jgi:uncharacterized membrane protein YdbT with pleckstrin-like domain
MKHDENQQNSELKPELEPIRGSIVVLVFKLAVILLFFEFIYAAADYIVTLGIPLPFDLHHHVSLALFVVEAVKIVFQLYLIANVVLSWANNTYYLAGKHIIKRTGILHVEEDVFHFDNIRSISISQSFLGKLFNYGNITLKTSASGGYQGDVVMMGIANPKKYEEILNKYF